MGFDNRKSHPHQRITVCHSVRDGAAAASLSCPSVYHPAFLTAQALGSGSTKRTHAGTLSLLYRSRFSHSPLFLAAVCLSPFTGEIIRYAVFPVLTYTLSVAITRTVGYQPGALHVDTHHPVSLCYGVLRTDATYQCKAQSSAHVRRITYRRRILAPHT